MHDDTHIHKAKQVYLHLLGVIPSFHNKGIGKKLCRYATENLPADKKGLERTACIRLNNLASIRIANKELCMSMVSRKQLTTKTFDNHPMIGSQETNFNASSKVKPITNPDEVNTRLVWETGKARPNNADEFLIPITQGEEDQLDPVVVSQIDKIMAFDNEPYLGKFVMRGIFKGKELGLNTNLSYLYFTKT